MTRHILIISFLVSMLTPFTVYADNHDEVTIRVMQMDEDTPDSVINRIELPAVDETPAAEPAFAAHELNELTNQELDFADEMDTQGFQAEIEIQGMQNEFSTQSHGK